MARLLRQMRDAEVVARLHMGLGVHLDPHGLYARAAQRR